MTFLRLSGTSGPTLLETGRSDPPPVGSISHVGTDAALEQADPFSREEIEGIDKVDPARIPDARRSILNGWTELWLSEVIALVVEDVESRTAQAASGSRIESTESALQVAHRRTDRLGPGSAGVENGLSSHPENEKAPEMFNHFRCLVLLNNGGEIGTFRTRPSNPLNSIDTGTSTQFCYKFLLQISLKTSYLSSIQTPPVKVENGKRKPRFTVGHMARTPQRPEGCSARLEPKRVHRIAQNRQQARSPDEKIGVSTHVEASHRYRSATHCRAYPCSVARNVLQHRQDDCHEPRKRIDKPCHAPKGQRG